MISTPRNQIYVSRSFASLEKEWNKISVILDSFALFLRCANNFLFLYLWYGILLQKKYDNKIKYSSCALENKILPSEFFSINILIYK